MVGKIILKEEAQSMRRSKKSSARFPHRPPNLANAVHVLEPLPDFASETLEGVGVLVVLQILQPLADLRERHSAAKVDAIDGCEDNDDGKQDQQLPNLGVKHLIQEPFHIALAAAIR